jgi:CoA:oxalate CoA-transferase
MAKPLEGIVVLDNSLYEVGPRSTMFLADMGATVIKVEPPEGEFYRSYAKFLPFAERQISISNRNKKGIRLNLKSVRGMEVFRDLVAKADVFVEAFRPGVAKELGIDYETLRVINPGLIYLSIAIYGQTGPYHQIRGYDIIAQAAGGMLGYYDPPPRGQFLPLSDFTSPIYAALAVLLALHHRRKTGRGQHIDLSCQDVMYATNFLAASYDCLKGRVDDSVLDCIAGVYPHGQYPRLVYGFYKTKDDNYVFVAPLQEEHWRAFVDVVGSEELRDQSKYGNLMQRAKHSDDGARIVAEWVLARTRDEVKKTMDKAGIPCEPVVRPEELRDDPQLNAREMLVEVSCPELGKFKIAGVPMKLSDTPGAVECAGPKLGEHTEEILASLLGYGEDRIAELRREGVV